jgi:hypothetical protein
MRLVALADTGLGTERSTLMTRRGFPAALVIAMATILLVCGSAVGQEARAADDFFHISGIRHDSTCADVRFNIYVNNSQPGYLSVVLRYDGDIVSDNILTAPQGTFPAFSSSGYQNERGLAPVNRWPLQTGRKVDIVLTLYDQSFRPLSESRAVMQSCDATTLKKTLYGVAYQLLQNGGFELAAQDSSFLPIPTVPAFWSTRGTTNDARVCGGSADYAGDCGYLFTADTAAKSHLTQTYSGTIGDSGDTITLQGFAERFAGYGGKAKLIATLTFANGTSKKIAVGFPAGQSPYNHPDGFPYAVSTKLPAPLVAATVKIKQGAGSGQIAIDAVTLTVFTTSGASLRQLPIPSAP